MNDMLIRMGTVLRRRRRLAGLTLSDLSGRCGVAAPQLSRIENGLVDPRFSTLARILAATGGSLADVAVGPVRITGVDEVLRRRAENRARLEAAGIASSDPFERLDERERRGDDTSAERAVLT